MVVLRNNTILLVETIDNGDRRVSIYTADFKKLELSKYFASIFPFGRQLNQELFAGKNKILINVKLQDINEPERNNVYILDYN